MNIKKELNGKRLLKLIHNDLRHHAKTIVVSLLLIVVCLTLMPISISSTYLGYFIFLYIGGFTLTASSFRVLHSRQEAHMFLLLPCSTLEKFINKWICSSVFFAVGLLVLCYLFSILNSVMYPLVFKKQIPFINIMSSDLWFGIGKYLILQSLVFLGAIVFKKNAFIKTMLVFTSFILLSAICVILISFQFYQGYSIKDYFLVLHEIYRGSDFIFWVAIAPLCWYLTFLKLTHSEIK